VGVARFRVIVKAIGVRGGFGFFFNVRGPKGKTWGSTGMGSRLGVSLLDTQ